MKTETTVLLKSRFFKYLIVFVIVFFFSLPFTGRMCRASVNTYRVSVSTGYLALRTAPSYDSSNEIGQLYSGEMVEATDYRNSSYWYVYSPKLGCSGYVNCDYLVYAASSSSTWTVAVSKGYLALRNAKAFDASNEIGQLYNGDTVDVTDASDDTYWYVYSPKLCQYGYVNRNYLYGGSVEVWKVSVSKGYLALRNAKAYDESNEIGELYTGDIVQPIDTSDSCYWYVYSPKLQQYGYVNKDYLYGGRSTSVVSSMRTVHVAKGYLALRCAKAYDASNEIGELYSGDTVQLIDTSDATYWYVYSPKYAAYGFVNRNYLENETSYPIRTVSVAKGYLALRCAMAYDEDNEIGQLYSGDTVEVIDSSDSSYWYVYSPTLDRYGYVNKDYLF